MKKIWSGKEIDGTSLKAGTATLALFFNNGKRKLIMNIFCPIQFLPFNLGDTTKIPG